MSRPLIPDHYATLGVVESAPYLTIQTAYRRLMRVVHPDVAGCDPSAMARALEVNAAWSVLRDPSARALYDRERAAANGTPARALDSGVSSWRPGGVRPVTIEELRDAAARESAYSEIGRQQREAFSAASRRVGIMVLLVGMVMLALVTLR